MGSKKSGSQNVTQRTVIPKQLRPLVEQQVETGIGGLRGITQAVENSGGVVQPFNQDQRTAINLTRDIALGGGGFIPAAQQQFLQTAQGEGGLRTGTEALDQLRATASGEGFNSAGFQSAFESALGQATPRIKGAFSLAGRSGSGLAQAAQSQAAADAFANLFGQERQRQLQASGVLSGLQNQERSRQLQAAGLLPGLAFTGSNALQGIGQFQQQQAQRERLGPITAQEILLSAAGGNVPLGSLLGQQSRQPTFSNPASGILGGAATGAALGSVVPGIGTAVGAIGGGLLGGISQL